ncbi:MAG: hypothetical protein RJA07_1691 [Bacteroidota bacterium]|jgi:hypothetical protein
MKHLFFISAFFLFSFSVIAQVNLVPNPSFEDTINCPDMISQIEKCKDWFNYGNSPDYFNECAKPLPLNFYSNATIPVNSLGVQYAASGKAYAGLVTHDSTTIDYREYIGCQLNNLLQIGTKYYVSFKISLADSSWFSSNKIGISFTKFSHSLSNPILPNNKSIVYSHQIISDTSNWTRITGSFVADSIYEYLVLGNFFTDNQTSFLLTHSHSQLLRDAYYYVDDICVSTDSIYAFNYVYTGINEVNKNINEISIQPNPTTHSISCTLPDETKSIEIENIIGQKVLIEKIEPSTKSYSKDVSLFPNGLYFLTIKTKNFSQTIKFIKQ